MTADSRRRPGKTRSYPTPQWHFCSTTLSMWIIREPCALGLPLCLDSKRAPVRCQQLGVRSAMRFSSHISSRHSAKFSSLMERKRSTSPVIKTASTTLDETWPSKTCPHLAGLESPRTVHKSLKKSALGKTFWLSRHTVEQSFEKNIVDGADAVGFFVMC